MPGLVAAQHDLFHAQTLRAGERAVRIGADARKIHPICRQADVRREHAVADRHRQAQIRAEPPDGVEFGVRGAGELAQVGLDIVKAGPERQVQDAVVPAVGRRDEIQTVSEAHGAHSFTSTQAPPLRMLS